MSPLIEEVRRRKVFRVAVVYAATAFVVLQAADLTLPRLGVPEWAMSLIVVLLLLGFPVALVLGWALELTPDGVRVTRAASAPAGDAGGTADTGEPLPALLGRRTVAVAALLVAVGAGLGAGLVIGPPRSTQPVTGRQYDGIGRIDDVVADRSIAVLPFADFSAGGDQEWFSDGLTEEILNALARLPDLRVASRSASFRFRDSGDEVRTVAAGLGVAHILEGSVRRTGERIRITAQLIRAGDGVQLWSQNFDRDAVDVIRVQEEIAFEIARTMRTALEPDALRRMVTAGTNSVAAYEAYLRGEHLIRQRAFSEAYAAWEEARTLDPQFSDAHLRAANHWLSELMPTAIVVRPQGPPYREGMQLAQERLKAAAATATDDVRRVRVEAIAAEVDLRFRDAMELAQRLVELQPQGYQAWMYLNALAGRASEHEIAAAALRRAEELVEEDASYLASLAVRYARLQDTDAALRLFDRALALDPGDPLMLYHHHLALLWAGRVGEGASTIERFAAAGGEAGLAAIMQLGQACAEGRTGDATRLLTGLDGGNRWLGLRYLGRDAEVVELLRPLDDAGELYSLATYLHQPFFDARPFPNLSAALRRQRITRPAPAAIPYACRTDRAGATPTAGQD